MYNDVLNTLCVIHYNHFCLADENAIVSQTQKDFEIKANNWQVVTMWVVLSLTMIFFVSFSFIMFF